MGRRNCGDYCAKASRAAVTILNVLFFALGAAVLVAGGVLFQKISSLANESAILSDLNLQEIALIVIAAGGAVIATSICGIVGAIKANRKCLIFYAVTLFAIICIEVATGAYMDSVSDATLQAKWDSSSPPSRQLFQNYMDCCGWAQTYDSIPYPSCQQPSAADIASGFAVPLTVPVQTCQYRTLAFIQSEIKPVALAAVVIGSIELISLFSTCGIIFSSKDIKSSDFDEFGG